MLREESVLGAETVRELFNCWYLGDHAFLLGCDFYSLGGEPPDGSKCFCLWFQLLWHLGKHSLVPSYVPITVLSTWTNSLHSHSNPMRQLLLLPNFMNEELEKLGKSMGWDSSPGLISKLFTL